MRIRRFTVATIAAALALTACGTAEGPTVASSDPTPTGSATPTQTPSPFGTLVVYTTAPAFVQDPPGAVDVWLYDVSEDRTRRLTDDGEGRLETMAQFRDATHVTFVANRDDTQEILEIDLTTGEERRLFEPPAGWVWSADWGPSGARLAMIEDVGDGKAVRIYSAETGAVRSIFDLPRNVGRGGSVDDEIAAHWSPDGRYLSVVDTVADYGNIGDPEPPISVIRPDGTVVADGMTGTLARWSSDSRRLYYRAMYAAEGSAWSYVDVETGARGGLFEGARGLVYPAVSPDGRYLTFSDDSADSEVRVVDLETKDERVVARGLAPIWLSATELGVTDVEPCEDCGEWPPWQAAGRARKIDIEGGDPARLALHLTGPPGTSDVHYG